MTPHINAKLEDISKKVIMPGDPNRALFIANHYLNDYKVVSAVRGISAYTGMYKDKMITVMASGMGCPSMGIYSYELFNFYNVESIIRVGTCGAYTSALKLYDIILATSSYSESSYAYVQNGCKDKVLYSSKELNHKINEYVNDNQIKLKEGTVNCSDVFYKENDDFMILNKDHNCLAVEMETFALFHNANVLNKQATALLTVSDNLVTHEVTTPEERETNLIKMIEIALEAI